MYHLYAASARVGTSPQWQFGICPDYSDGEASGLVLHASREEGRAGALIMV